MTTFTPVLPLGTYKVILEVDGKDVDSVDNVNPKLGDPTVVNFDLQKQAAQRQETAKAAETGTLTKEQERGMTRRAEGCPREGDQRAAGRNGQKQGAERCVQRRYGGVEDQAVRFS